jgi:hypothetical protein
MFRSPPCFDELGRLLGESDDAGAIGAALRVLAGEAIGTPKSRLVAGST